ncbi:MAG: hypothetical protein ACSLE0_13765, partial [Chitinophagaceae bacterium]
VFLEKMPAGIIGYTINGAAVKDSWKKIRVYFNGTAIPKKIMLDYAGWKFFIRNNQLVKNDPRAHSLELMPFTCSILFL